MKTIYCAHATCLYGEPDEKKELKAIRSRFRNYRIVNPSRHIHPDRDTMMEFYEGLAAKCDIVAYSCLFGTVTAGVGKEVNHALSLGKSVYKIGPRGLVQRKRQVSYADPRRTRHLHGKWRRERMTREIENMQRESKRLEREIKALRRG
jgi:hypothetical protein